MDISGALALASQSVALVKSLKDLDHSLDKAELKGQMVELYAKLADVKMALVDAQQELHEKDRQIKQLLDQSYFVNDLITVQGFQYDAEHGKPVGLPYCPTCIVRENKYYRLGQLNDAYSECHNCKNSHRAASDGNVNKSVKLPR